MHKFFVFLCCFLFTHFSIQAQYTETINSNRPGNSQGAFAVGYRVLQLETGFRFGQKNHDLTGEDATLYGLDYSLRYGLGFERLEVNVTGTFLASNITIPYGANDRELKYRDFKSNTLGLKYLLYDPYRKRSKEPVNIYSWDANFEFQWRDLIPAVSVYAGGNIVSSDNPYLWPEEPNISPKAAIITQHNYGRWVLVMNFIADKIGTDFPTYAGIFTLTHSFNRKFAIFGEYQLIKSDWYSDDIARAGAAYLISRNFQIHLSGLKNFKNTPSRWEVALGASYRLDMRKSNEVFNPGRRKQQDWYKEKK